MFPATALKHISINRNRAPRLLSHLNSVHCYHSNVRKKKAIPQIILRNIQSIPVQETSQKSQKLEILLPDLTPQELRYVQRQVEVIHSPKCMEPLTSQSVVEKSQPGNELHNNLPSSYADLNDPLLLKRIFPIHSKKGSFHSLNICTLIVRESGYPSFVIPNSKGEVFRRNFQYPLVAERIVASLQTWGVTDEDLQKDPLLTIDTLPVLVKYGKTSELFNLSFSEAKQLYHEGKKKTPLRGHLIREKIRQLEKSLKMLGFSDIGDNIKEHAAHKFSRLPNANIYDVDEICDSLVVEEFIKLAECSNDVNGISRRKPQSDKSVLSGFSDAQAVARNYYLFKKILAMKYANGRNIKARYLIKSCLKSCPLETLILLNSYWKVLNENDGRDSSSVGDYTNHLENNNLKPNSSHYTKFIENASESKGFQRLINFPAYGFPVSLKDRYFSSMGFAPNEVKHLILSEESYDLKSNDSHGNILHYTQHEYIPTMKERLSILRENGPKMGLCTPSEYFKLMKNWSTFLTRLGEEAKKCDNSANKYIPSKSDIKLNTIAMKIFGDVVQELINSSDRSCLNSVLTYLQDYFAKGESKNHLGHDFFERPKYDRFSSKSGKNLKPYQIYQTLNWLENRGFNKHQIRTALPLLFYYPAILEQKLFEIQEMDEFQPWHKQPEALNSENTENNHILQVLLYLIEKEFNYTDEGTYFAEGMHEKAKSLNGYLSKELCQEILAYSGVEIIPEKSESANSTDDIEQIFLDLNYENVPSLELGKIHFQDYMYLYDATMNPNHVISRGAGSTPTHSTKCSRLGVSDNLSAKTTVRLFSSRTHNILLESNQTRNMTTNSHNEGKKGHSSIRFPRALIFVNPFLWFDMKLKYLNIANTLDPKFSEEEFRKGAKQAVSTLTHLIASNEFDEMNGMLTQRELHRIKKELENESENDWKNNIAISVDDIIGITTESIERYPVGRAEYVDIVLRIHALKDSSITEKSNTPTCITATAEFSKEFSEKSFGDWSISKFNIVDIKRAN